MNKQRRCVISGIGLATPAGCDKKTFWQTLEKGTSLFEKKPIFKEKDSSVPVACVDERQIRYGVPPRQAKKLDRFTILSIAAAHEALADAEIEINDENRDGIGILIGNCTGGWSYVEPMMYPLYTQGMEAINPYVATAWFPAAPQGEISILDKIGGYSKTISAERISAGLAVEQALRTIKSGRADVMLAGGAEAPLNSLVLNAYLQEGAISPSGQYQPFNPEADGSLLGEGAAILMIEESERAKARGAKIYGEIAATGKGTSLKEAMQACLEAAGIQKEDIDYVVLDGRGNPERDDEEYRAITEVLPENNNLRMSSPQSLCGNLIGASMAVSLAIGCISLEEQVLLPTPKNLGEIKTPMTGKHVVGSPEPRAIKYVLVNGRDADGQSLVVLLAKQKDEANNN